LSGKYTAETTFAANDHRTYNRHGEAFDRGETFSGVDFEVGIEAATRLAAAVPAGVSLPAAALAWITSLPGITAVIPGARNVTQATSNAGAGDLLDLEGFDAAVRETYAELLRPAIHPHW